MSKVLRCRDVGVDCDYVARGQSVEDVMRRASEHGRSEHGMRELPPELAERARAAIRDERDVS